jgi:hypothetical protein
MSTRDAMNRLIQGGQIVHVPCQLRGVSSRRHVFLEASLHDRLAQAMTGSTKDDIRLAGLWADLDRFTSGSVITVGGDPFNKGQTAFMARTHPVQDGIFDLRSRDPSPGIRLFGAFCETDVFLGLTWKWRHELGSRHDRLFDLAVLEATGVWDRLLPDCRRLVSDRIEDCISDDFIPV